MKNILLFFFLACILLPLTGSATINISAVEDVNDPQALIIRYTADDAYNSAPSNIWNSQLFTLRWPESFGETAIATVANLSAFSFGQDGVTDDGEDGWYYAKFTSSGDNVILNMDIGMSIDMVRITFQNNVDPCMVELVTIPNGWVSLNTGRASVNNAVSGEQFNTFSPASCGVVDVEEVVESFSIRLYPSPASDEAFVDLITDQPGSGMLKIYDDAGRLVINQEEEWNTGENSIRMDISHLASGVYLVRLGEEFDAWTGELIKIE